MGDKDNPWDKSIGLWLFTFRLSFDQCCCPMQSTQILIDFFFYCSGTFFQRSKPGKFHVGQEEVAVVAELFLKTVLEIGPIDMTNGQRKR